jgi:hypothetical protein
VKERYPKGLTRAQHSGARMAKELSDLMQAALASGALLIPACSTSEPVAPEPPAPALEQDTTLPSVVAASVSDGVLTVRFSEPVTPPDSVDPRKFRLTFGYYSSSKADSYYYYSDYYTASHVARTWYTDVGRFAPEATPIRQTAPNTIRLPLPADFNAAWVCDDVARIKKRDPRARPGLYLHYAERGGPGITDRRGNRLRSIAPYWLTAASSTVPGDFTDKPIPVGVRCR